MIFGCEYKESYFLCLRSNLNWRPAYFLCFSSEICTHPKKVLIEPSVTSENKSLDFFLVSELASRQSADERAIVRTKV